VSGAPTYFHPKVDLIDTAGGQYILNVQSASCGGSFCGNITTWESIYNQYLNASACTATGNCSDSVPRPTQVVVQVIRVGGSASACANYALRLSNL
jgi:hypothetical protein